MHSSLYSVNVTIDNYDQAIIILHFVPNQNNHSSNHRSNTVKSNNDNILTHKISIVLHAATGYWSRLTGDMNDNPSIEVKKIIFQILKSLNCQPSITYRYLSLEHWVCQCVNLD